MFVSIWHRLDLGARLALPFVTALVCTLIGVIAWPLPYIGPVAPPLSLMAVYYWTVYRPDLFGPSVVFAIGLLNDIVNDLPIGLSALLYVAASQILLQQRRFFARQSFFMIWFGFILTVSAVMAAEWLLLDILHWTIVPVMPVLMQTILAVAFFPLPCWLFIALQRLALPHED